MLSMQTGGLVSAFLFVLVPCSCGSNSGSAAGDKVLSMQTGGLVSPFLFVVVPCSCGSNSGPAAVDGRWSLQTGGMFCCGWACLKNMIFLLNIIFVMHRFSTDGSALD